MGIIANTLKQRWTAYWLHVIDNPKTSLQGALSFIAILCLALAAIIPPSAKLYPVLVAITVAIPKVLIAFSQKDPGQVPAITPDNPVPHLEPSSEVPINPEATVVVPKGE